MKEDQTAKIERAKQLRKEGKSIKTTQDIIKREFGSQLSTKLFPHVAFSPPIQMGPIVPSESTLSHIEYEEPIIKQPPIKEGEIRIIDLIHSKGKKDLLVQTIQFIMNLSDDAKIISFPKIEHDAIIVEAVNIGHWYKADNGKIYLTDDDYHLLNKKFNFFCKKNGADHGSVSNISHQELYFRLVYKRRVE